MRFVPPHPAAVFPLQRIILRPDGWPNLFVFLVQMQNIGGNYMKLIMAIALMVVGGWLIYIGYQQQESVGGSVESFANKVASKVDGKSRAAQYTWYYVGGGALFILGFGSLALSWKKI